jgi:hypothetical protein
MQNVFGPTPVATSGVCVFGQGDCGPKVNNVSQSFNQTLTENIKNTLVSKSTSIGAVMATEQIVDFSGADLSKCESVTISGISQKAVLNYNFSAIESSYDETQFSNMIRSNVEKTLKQKADVKSEALNGGNTGTVNNITQNYNNTVDRLVNSINYNDFKNIMSEMKSRQKISFAGMTLGGKFCNISNIGQDVMMDMASKLLSEKVTKEFTQLAKENAEKSATDSENKFAASGVLGDLGRGFAAITTSMFTGLGNIVGEMTKPFIMIAIVIIVAIVAYVIYRTLMSGEGKKVLEDPKETREAELKMKELDIEAKRIAAQNVSLGPPGQGQQGFAVNPAIAEQPGEEQSEQGPPEQGQPDQGPPLVTQLAQAEAQSVQSLVAPLPTPNAQPGLRAGTQPTEVRPESEQSVTGRWSPEDNWSGAYGESVIGDNILNFRGGSVYAY